VDVETRPEGDRVAPFERLDFVYMPSRDVAADAGFFVGVLGGRLVFAIDDGGTRVAMIELTETAPRILLADHLDGDRPILVYRVHDLDMTLESLEGRGWRRERTLQIPHGPCCSFAAPGGQRLAVYQLTRPEVGRHFDGRRDFPVAGTEPGANGRRREPLS
jgi:hypothetical protein